MARWAVVGLAAIALLSGCRSPYVNATVRNETGARVTLVEVDYPSASFGRETLATGATFNYRFKILGSGAVKASWTDFQRGQRSATGPELHEGQQGDLVITLMPLGRAQWDARLTPEH